MAREWQLETEGKKGKLANDGGQSLHDDNC